MYKVIVIDEDGKESVTDDVLDYNLIDKDMVQDIATNNLESDELTDEEIKCLEDSLGYWEELPDTYQLEGLIQDIIDDRE